MLLRHRRRVAAVAAGLAAAIALSAGAAVAAGTGEAGGGLVRFYRQRVDWHGCRLGPEDAEGEALDQAGAQCAEVTVPLDYGRPAGRTIEVAISRLRSTDPAGRLGSLVINVGGPATPVLALVLPARQAMAGAARFDLVGMDVRFAGRSTPLDRGWPSAWLPRSAGAGRRGFDRMVALERDLARRCAREHGDLLPHAATANIARDMDVIRAVLGEPKLSYVGYSQGSYLGALYTELFPDRAGRMVLDSAIDPARPGTLALPGNTSAREAALRDWAGWAARHDDRYHLGATAAQVLATIERAYLAAARHPLRVGRYEVDDTVMPAVLIDPLSDDGDVSNDQLAVTVGVLARAATDGAAEPTPELDAALAGLLTGAESARRSAQSAIMCADAAVERDPERYWRDIEAHRSTEPLFGPVGRNVPVCAFWAARPEGRPMRVRNGVPALVVNATGDVNATYEMGLAMHKALAGSRLITLAGVRTHGVYALAGSACVDAAVDAYLVTGTLPARDLVCERPA